MKINGEVKGALAQPLCMEVNPPLLVKCMFGHSCAIVTKSCAIVTNATFTRNVYS